MPEVPAPRTIQITRKTGETDIRLTLDLDGSGQSEISTGVGFLNHMLTLFSKHSLIDVEVWCKGDIHVDAHHTTEDVGIALGQAIDHALGDKAGIRRYGHCTLPMDETLVTTAVDLGGRPFWFGDFTFPSPRVGDFDTELVAEFWQAFATNAKANVHVVLHHGKNSHHVSEAIFKSLARSIRMAVERDPRVEGIPSTKGVL